MQKMAKRGFRGERKENPHPVPLPRRRGMLGRKSGGNLPPYTYSALAVHRPSYCWLPQRGGMWRGKSKGKMEVK